ncbi:MAG TPA: HAD family hydrolase, partial [Acidimicrobiales bacterium]|nr:HAD family hydrolase [Acidimicrobiales bacterium]
MDGGGLTPSSGREAWILDLDGVVWLAHQPIAGAVEAVARLDDAGHDVLFVT